MVPGFVIEKWEGPSAALEAAAAILVTPSTETFVVVVNLMSWSPHRTTVANPFWIHVASFRQAQRLAA
jgi:hypothetical protein